MSSEDIFNITTQYTTLYEKKKPAASTYFATKNGAHFLKAHISRKRIDSGRRVERKIVYIMKADVRGIYCCKHRLIEEKKRKEPNTLCRRYVYSIFSSKY